MIEPNILLIEKICEGSDREVDPVLKKLLLEAKGKPVDEYKTGLHKALDFAARGSLTSDFVMQVLDIEWKRVGGNTNDPAPWRNDF